MRKKKTIPCDYCGARLENIPERCPVCGEIIYDRMDPHIRERIKEKLKKPNPYLLLKLHSLILCASILEILLIWADNVFASCLSCLIPLLLAAFYSACYRRLNGISLKEIGIQLLFLEGVCIVVWIFLISFENHYQVLTLFFHIMISVTILLYSVYYGIKSIIKRKKERKT